MSDRDSAASPLLVVTGVGKRFERPRPSSWAGRLVARLNTRAGSDDLDDDDWVDPYDDVEESQPTRDWAVQDVSFSVGPGGGVAVVGERLEGASALLRVLGGVSPSTTGKALATGRTVYVSNEMIAAMPRDCSIREASIVLGLVLGIPPRVTIAALPAILDFAGVDADPRRRTRSMAKLELGRVAVAVALHSGASVFLYDADIAFQRSPFHARVWAFLACRLADGCGLVASAPKGPHALGGLCEHALLLEGGTVAATGTLGEVEEERRRRSGNDRDAASTDTWGTATCTWSLPDEVGARDHERERVGADLEALSVIGSPEARVLGLEIAPQESTSRILCELAIPHGVVAPGSEARFTISAWPHGRAAERFVQPRPIAVGTGARTALRVEIAAVLERVKQIDLSVAVELRRGAAVRMLHGETVSLEPHKKGDQGAVGPGGQG